MQRLVTIIREDLSPGYQIAQTVHAVAEYVMTNSELAKQWHIHSNYVLALSVSDADELVQFGKKLWNLKIKFNMFYEPDVNEVTSIAFISTPETDLITKGMPLAGKTSGSKAPAKVKR